MGDRIAYLGLNSSDVAEIFFAAVRIGAVYVPLNFRLTPPELCFIVGDCTPSAVFYDQSFQSIVEEIDSAIMPNLMVASALDGTDSAYEDLISVGGMEVAPAAANGGAAKNKRLILRYLVPVRMVLGSFASEALLQKYRLPFFVALCRAVHRGDLAAFERELTAHQQLFIRHGSYLLVERAKTIAYRNFFKIVHELHPAGTTKLDISAFKTCLDAVGLKNSMDKEEIECVVANLIYKGYIKGYLSHQHSKLVVSKANGFPALRDVLGE